MKSKTFANVWDALEDNPAAATITMRSNVALTDTVRAWNLTQAKAARRLGITLPRLNDLLRGRIDKFSLDTLLTRATRAGLNAKLDKRRHERNALPNLGAYIRCAIGNKSVACRTARLIRC